MRILSIKFKEHLIPKGSCGTGYSEPDVFIVETDVVTKDIWIDVWYRDKEDYCKIFTEAIHSQLEDCYKHFEGQIDTKVRNMDEAYQMYLNAIYKKL